MTATARRLARRCRERFAAQGLQPTMKTQPEQRQATSTDPPPAKPKPA